MEYRRKALGILCHVKNFSSLLLNSVAQGEVIFKAFYSLRSDYFLVLSDKYFFII